MLYPLSYGDEDFRPGENWWSGRGSNPRPSHCERDALPTELPPHDKGGDSSQRDPARPMEFSINQTQDARASEPRDAHHVEGVVLFLRDGSDFDTTELTNELRHVGTVTYE